jgi:glucosamine--fructose-6-phosphate aminotransferase (isomerizing)
MTEFLQDILRQPEELLSVIDYLEGTGRKILEAAACAIRGARYVFVTGIGASWNAALAAGPLFYAAGIPVHMLDASELLVFGMIPRDAVLLILSRSGRSVEIVRLIEKARAAGATVIGVTNFEDGVLAIEADIPVVLRVKADHGISVNTYSALAVAAAAIAGVVAGSFDAKLAGALSLGLAEVQEEIPEWRKQIEHSSWFVSGSPYYFLARGSSLASAYEAALLWEEGAKAPAIAMGAGSFRHGPQEVVTKDTRFGIWIDGEQMREQDLALARDLERIGASVMVIGHALPEDASSLVVQLPALPPEWQFLIDIFPVQLAAEFFARLRLADCDSFRFASYIVLNEHGILTDAAAHSLNVAGGTAESD